MELHPDPARKLSENLYDIYNCRVQWKTPDNGHRNCPKHVQFYSKNKFEKFVHLVGFIIKKYLDARSCERQKLITVFTKTIISSCPEADDSISHTPLQVCSE
jgi:hypothetical protein